MRRAFLIVTLAAMFALDLAPAMAQSNDNPHTPLNSRIRREQPYPTEPRTLFQPRELTRVERDQSRGSVNQFARCLYDRNNGRALEFLAQTDYGFRNYQQIGLDQRQLLRLYPIETCLQRVATSRESGVLLTYSPDALRRGYVQAAYLRNYPQGPSWAVPGHAAAEREFPLSANDPYVRMVMDLADCVVASDPHAADFYFRTAPASADERAALNHLVPLLGPCLPAGLQLEIDPAQLRAWLGEGLWHAARASRPVPPPGEQD